MSAASICAYAVLPRLPVLPACPAPPALCRVHFIFVYLNVFWSSWLILEYYKVLQHGAAQLAPAGTSLIMGQAAGRQWASEPVGQAQS